MSPISFSLRSAFRHSASVGILAAVLCGLAVSGLSAPAQPAEKEKQPMLVSALSGAYRKNGTEVRNAFKFVSVAARNSVAQLLVDGKAVALGTVVDAGGLVATKASELIAGKLTAKLADDREVDARILAVDEDNDVALVKIEAKGLTAIHWNEGETAPGEWVATQGLATIPDAVGIISGIPRKILPPRALIGVNWGSEGEGTRVAALVPGFGAEKAGIQVGDVILGFDGQTMKTRTELSAALRELPAGRVVKVQLQRGADVIETAVTLTGEAALNAAQAQTPGRGSRGAGAGNGRGGRGNGRNFTASGVSKRAEDFDLVLQHDTVLEPWECGGPLLDLYGRAVGLNIARAGRVSSYALPAALVQKIITELKTRAE
jgi:serine protease Do